MDHDIEFVLPAQQPQPGMPTRNADACIPLFSMKAVENKAKSTEAGRPIYDEVEWLKIIIPGDRDSPERRVRAADKERWPQQYMHFQNTRRAAIEGTPLDRWPALDVARCAELKAINIFTVESVASLSDDAIAKIGPGTMELVAKAKEFLQFAAGETAAANQLDAANDAVRELREAADQKDRIIDELRASIDEQNQELAELREQLAELTPQETPAQRNKRNATKG